jgi:hypothetical protein
MLYIAGHIRGARAILAMRPLATVVLRFMQCIWRLPLFMGHPISERRGFMPSGLSERVSAYSYSVSGSKCAQVEMLTDELYAYAEVNSVISWLHRQDIANKLS